MLCSYLPGHINAVGVGARPKEQASNDINRNVKRLSTVHQNTCLGAIGQRTFDAMAASFNL